MYKETFDIISIIVYSGLDTFLGTVIGEENIRKKTTVNQYTETIGNHIDLLHDHRSLALL